MISHIHHTNDQRAIAAKESTRITIKPVGNDLEFHYHYDRRVIEV